MTLFRSLAAGRKHRFERVIIAGELLIEPTDPSAPEDESKVVEEIIAIVSKYYASDSIMRMTTLHERHPDVSVKRANPSRHF